MKKKKKKKKPEIRRIEALTEPRPTMDAKPPQEKTPKETAPPPPVSTPKTPAAKAGGPRRRGGFYWGLGLGFLATLSFIVVNDAGWSLLPVASSAAGGDAAPGTTVEAGVSGIPVFLTGKIPEGGRVYVDGVPARVTEEAAGVRVSVPPASQRMEIKGAQGTWWTTSLAGGVSEQDTLNPLLGGDVVVELEHQALGGTLYLDGEKRGTVPGSLRDVSPGWHIVSVRNGETLIFEDGCVVKPGEVSVIRVPPVPPRGKGRLVVRSRILEKTGYRESEGNVVIIDGTMVGETPLSATLDTGFHSVRIEVQDHPTRTEVIHLEAGATRYVNAEFGREQRLRVSVSPPREVDTDSPLAIPVRVESERGAVLLQEGFLQIVRPGQSKPVEVPLVPSGTDPHLWVAVVPLDVVSLLDELVGYAHCVDDLGHSGDSELFRVSLN